MCAGLAIERTEINMPQFAPLVESFLANNFVSDEVMISICATHKALLYFRESVKMFSRISFVGAAALGETPNRLDHN